MSTHEAAALQTRKFDTQKMVTLAVLSAIAFVVMLVGRVPVVLFLKYDPKDVIIAIAGFIYGPMSALAVTVVVSFVEMITVSTTGPIGFIMNVLGSAAFACTAAFVYKKNRTMTGAIAGLLLGAVMMTGVMLLWNYFITPLYMRVEREYVQTLLLPVFLPFNALKSGLNAALVVLLYKPLVEGLRKAHLIPESTGSAAKAKVNVGAMITAGVVLISCILAILVWTGVI